jgi:hypothetical protein
MYNFHLEIRDYFHDLNLPFDWTNEKVVPKNADDIDKVISYLKTSIEHASKQEDKVFLLLVMEHSSIIYL